MVVQATIIGRKPKEPKSSEKDRRKYSTNGKTSEENLSKLQGQSDDNFLAHW